MRKKANFDNCSNPKGVGNESINLYDSTKLWTHFIDIALSNFLNLLN